MVIKRRTDDFGMYIWYSVKYCVSLWKMLKIEDMTKYLKLVMKMLLFGVLLGCQEDNKSVILRHAEGCMEAHPDSVIRMLDEMGENMFGSDSQRAKYALLWTQARHKCHLPLGNDSLINVAVDYYTRHKERHYAAKALLYKGMVHKERKEVEKAAEAFALSEQWFDGVEDDQYKALLYNHYGILMKSEENFVAALHYLKKTYHYELKGDSAYYAMLTCSSIANVYELLGNLDSAKNYFEKGLQYEGKVSLYRCSLFKQNYANFLRKIKEYEKTEQMLLECEQHITGERRYSLYSSLATLYYEMEAYHKALAFAEKVIEGRDSVVVRSGLLNLYRIHRQLGHVNESQHFHDLFRVYDSDIESRMKTAEVAAIPHEVKVKALESSQQKNVKVKWGLTVCLIAVVLASGMLYVLIRKGHKQQRQEWQDKLDEGDREMSEMAQIQSEKNREIGLLNYQMERKKEQIGHMELRQKERLQKEKEKVREKVSEIKQLKETESVIMREKRELEKDLETTLKEQRELQLVAAKVEHDRRIDQRIMRYRVRGKVEQIGALLMQLKHGNMYVGEEIPEEKYRPMIETLLDAECPGMRERIDALTNNLTKQLMCYLIALDLNDEEMMFRASCKKLQTVQRYRKECEELMGSLLY